MVNQERKLVTIRTLDEIKPHPNADLLELAIIGGWQVVVQKDQFKAGDLVVYFEIDSLIPITPEFEFLRKYAYVNKAWLVGQIPNNEGFRIRTIKLRGEISQGLVIPIEEHLAPEFAEKSSYNGDDISYCFNVIKYDPPVSVSQNLSIGRKGNFPSFITKTRQARVQNIPKALLQEVFNSKEKFEITRKYHGSSITVYAVNNKNYTLFEKIYRSFQRLIGNTPEVVYKVGVCSHNIELDITNKDNAFVKAAYSTGLIDALKSYSECTGNELAVQGELCGPKLQDNHHGLEEDTIFVFDIFDIKTQEYLLPIKRFEVLHLLRYNFKYIGFTATQEFNPMALPSPNYTELIKLGEYRLPSGKQNEGLVWKSLDRDFSFKAVSNKFLLEDK